MNRREHNRHAQPPAEAARDRLLERRQRLAKITGAPAPDADRLAELAPALEAAARLTANLGPTLDRVLEGTRKMAEAYGIGVREASANTARAIAALERDLERRRR